MPSKKRWCQACRRQLGLRQALLDRPYFRALHLRPTPGRRRNQCAFFPLAASAVICLCRIVPADCALSVQRKKRPAHHQSCCRQTPSADSRTDVFFGKNPSGASRVRFQNEQFTDRGHVDQSGRFYPARFSSGNSAETMLPGDIETAGTDTGDHMLFCHQPGNRNRAIMDALPQFFGLRPDVKHPGCRNRQQFVCPLVINLQDHHLFVFDIISRLFIILTVANHK